MNESVNACRAAEGAVLSEKEEARTLNESVNARHAEGAAAGQMHQRRLSGAAANPPSPGRRHSNVTSNGCSGGRHRRRRTSSRNCGAASSADTAAAAAVSVVQRRPRLHARQLIDYLRTCMTHAHSGSATCYTPLQPHARQQGGSMRARTSSMPAAPGLTCTQCVRPPEWIVMVVASLPPVTSTGGA